MTRRCNVSNNRIHTMFRRIEWIGEVPIDDWLTESEENIADFGFTRYFKYGITQALEGDVLRAWGEINVPRRAINHNCRFYFTEAGWKRYGRPTVAACRKCNVVYRVLAVKEHSVEVIYRDEWQVAVRPKAWRQVG